jgi:ubiquinone/menaquinone biosynthesis C-methylase UbiE
MNYGYINDELEQSPLLLEQDDVSERMCVNMYHQTVDFVDLKDKEVLEIGCGRGGGAYYISHYMKPKSYFGLDLNKRVVKACNRHYKVPGLSFVQGRADNLLFEDNSFDAVVNVESSRCYPDFEGFLREVVRVLRPGGYLLFSDMRLIEDHLKMKNQLITAGFKVIVEKNIVQNVVKALEIDDERRKKEIAQKTRLKIFRRSMNEFSGTVGTATYSMFKNGQYGYWHYVLQKAV